MRKAALFGLALAIAIATACVPLLQPFHRAGEGVFDPSFVGVWSEGEDTWEVTRADDTSYRLVHRFGDGSEEALTGHLVRLGSRNFLDLEPEWDPSEHFLSKAALPFYLLPTHQLFLLDTVPEGVRLRDMDDRWVSEHLSKKPGALKHIVFGKDVLLTGSPEELQTFFAKHAGEAFAGGDLYTRAPTAD